LIGIRTTHLVGDIEQPVSEMAIISTTAHEIGHMLGLDHNGDLNSVMSPNRARGTMPNSTDIAAGCP
jgi:predicted Zn-dependent protease